MLFEDDLGTGVAADREVCPLGYVIGSNGITIPWDSAIEKGDWDAIKDTIIAINMRTIIRNAMDSFDREYEAQVNLGKRIREDIFALREYFSDVHNTQIHIYAIDYDKLPITALPNYRAPKTDKQKETERIYKKILGECSDVIDKWYYDRVKIDCGFIISHIIYDMVHALGHVRLIETHTGAIKSRLELNTKLNLTDDERLLVPFSKITYFVYGDKQLFNKNVAISRKLFDVLNLAQISPLSSESRLTHVVQSRDPLMYKLLRKLLQ